MKNQTPSRNIAFILCLGAVFSLAPFAIDMYLPALPSMAKSLATQIDEMEASVAVFLLGYALSQLIFGPLSDHLGRIPVLLGGLIMFVCGSVLCGIATTSGELYLFRFIQALGGGASVVVFALVNDQFDVKRSSQVISYIMTVVVIAPLIAPIIGGEILIRFGWEWIFFGLAVYAALVLIATIFFIKDTKPQNEIIKGSIAQGFKQLIAAYCIVLTNSSAMAHILMGGFAFAGLFAFVAGSPFVYIVYFGVQEDHYGYLVGANAAFMIIMNVVNARLLHNIQPTRKAIAGVFIISIVSLALLIVNALGLGLWWIVVGVVSYIGMLGLISANAIAGAMANFNEQSGTVSAVYGVCQFSLGAVASAVISVLDSTNATPLTTVMAACGVLALISALPLIKTQGLIQTDTKLTD